MKFKWTKPERNWILYDVGNSAFILLVSTLIPIYFNTLTEQNNISPSDSVAYWGYTVSISTLLVALTGPIFGAISDKKGRKKPLFLASILIGATGCLCLGFSQKWLVFLILFAAAKISYSISLIFYDAMLPDIAATNRIDRLSAQGYAWGYIGSCIPFLVCIILVLGSDAIGISMTAAMTISFAIIAVWWMASSIPLLCVYRQKHFAKDSRFGIRSTFGNLWSSLKEIAANKHIFLFLLAFLFYIDGVYTIIEMATVYGSALGLDRAGLLFALLVTQIVAFPSSIGIGRLSQHVSTNLLISVCICAYFCIAVFAMFMTKQLHFWILALLVGLFQGGIQALSRGHFARMIPPEKSGEYFGLMDICGKGASFIGTTTISIVSQLTGSANLGIGALAVFFVVGLLLFQLSVRETHAPESSPHKY